MFTKDMLLELRKFVDMQMQDLIVEAPTCFRVSSNKAFEDNYATDCCEHTSIEDYVKHNKKPTFTKVLFDYIDKKAIGDTEIYKRAGIDRRHFSKIRSNSDYRPSKRTAIALALALELDKKKTDQLLSAAGYTLSDSDTYDLVIQFCLYKRIYNINDVNIALDYFSLKPLAGCVE